MKNLSGMMDRTIRIEAKTFVVENNVRKEAWETVKEVKAAKKDNPGTETESGNQVLATGRTEWTMRWFSTLKPMNRIVDITSGYPQTIYDIKSIAEVGRQEALVLQTTRNNA